MFILTKHILYYFPQFRFWLLRVLHVFIRFKYVTIFSIIIFSKMYGSILWNAKNSKPMIFTFVLFPTSNHHSRAGHLFFRKKVEGHSIQCLFFGKQNMEIMQKKGDHPQAPSKWATFFHHIRIENDY